MEKISYVKNNQKRPRVAILILDKIDFKSKTVTRDKGGHFILIKRENDEEVITIIYAPNNTVPRYMKQILTKLKGEIDSSTLIVGDFNTLLSIMERISYTEDQ